MARISGVTYYKLEERYPGDVTKGCSLIGKEIDNNFHFLRGSDVSSAYINEENGSLVITLVNGEKIIVENLGEYIASLSTELSAVTYDRDEGILTILSGDKEYSISGFTVPTDVFVETEGTDIIGDGTAENPIRINVAERTGMYAPVVMAETKDDFIIGERYILKELVEACSGQPAEWRYFIYDYDETAQEWVSTELEPGESVVIRSYKGIENAEVICILKDDEHFLEIKNKALVAKDALKLAENDVKREIRLKIRNGEKVLVQDENGLGSVLHIKYENLNNNPKLYLFGKDAEHPIDVYDLNDSVKIDSETEPYLSISLNGLKISGVKKAIDDAINALSGNVESRISREVHDINQSIARTNNTVQALSERTRNAISSANTRIDELSDATSNKIRVITSDIQALNNDVDEIERAIDALSGGVETKISNLSSETNQRIDGIENNFNRFKRTTQSALSAITNDLSDLDRETDSKFSSVNEKITALTNATTKANNDVAILSGSVIEKISAISGQASDCCIALNNRIDELSDYTHNQVQELRNEISRAETRVTAKVTTLDSKFENFALDTTGKIQQLNWRIDCLETCIDERFHQFSADTQAKINAVYRKINEVKTELEDEIEITNNRIDYYRDHFTEKIDEINSNLSQLSASTIRIEHKLDDFSGHVEDKFTNLSSETISLENRATTSANTYSEALAMSGQSPSGKIIYILNSEVISGVTYGSGAYIYTDGGLKKLDVTTPSTSQTLEERVEQLENKTGRLETNLNDLSSSTETQIEALWEELNKKDDGVITKDISFIGKEGTLITIPSGTTVTNAIEIVAENAGGGGGGSDIIDDPELGKLIVTIGEDQYLVDREKFEAPKKPTMTASGTYTGDTVVHLSTITSGSQIRYTVGINSEPEDPTKTTGTVGTSVDIAQNAEGAEVTYYIKAIAVKNGLTSPVETGTYVIKTQLPPVSVGAPTGNSGSTSRTVTLTCPYTWVQIKYTTDGSNPKTSGTAALYDGNPIVFSTKGTNYQVKAYALSNGCVDSSVASGEVFAVKQLGLTTISVSGNDNSAKRTVTISHASGSSVQIKYTINGGAEQTYTGPFDIQTAGTFTVKAHAELTGWDNSAETTKSNIVVRKLPNVSISVTGDNNSNPRIVTLTNSNTQAVIHYTLDGTTPTASSPVYTEPVTLSHTATVKAIATLSDWTTSNVVTQSVSVGYFMMYYGYSGETMTLEGITGLTQGNNADPIGQTLEATTPVSAYLWICIDKRYSFTAIKSMGFDVPLNEPIIMNDYKCYRSALEHIAGTITFTFE